MNIGISNSVTALSYTRIATAGIDPDQVIRDLFGPTDVGAWYDPSDSTTVYQDANGKTAAGVGDPVGLILDKSKGLALEPDWITNGGFDTDTVWTYDAGITIAGGVASFDGSGTQTLNQNGASTNKFYEIKLDLVSTNATGVLEVYHITLGGYVGFDISTTGSKKVYLKSGTIGSTFSLRGRSGFVGSIDNVSVRELPGNHATQTTSAARPVLQIANGTPSAFGSELVTNGTFDADTSGWTGINCTLAWVSGTAELTSTVVNQIKAAQSFTTVVGKTYRATATVWQGTTSQPVNLLIPGIGSSENVTTTTPTNVSYVFTATSTSTAVRAGTASNTPLGETCYVDNISVQEVTAWTGGQYYLDFDGVDDLMQAQYPSTLTDVTRSVGYRATQVNDFVVDDFDNTNYASLWTTNSNGNLRWATTNSNYLLAVGGWTLNQDAIAIAVALANGTKSLTGTGNSATTTTAPAPTSINGVSLGAAPGGLLPLDGRIYIFVDIGRALTAGETSDLESYLAAKSGVTLP